MKKLNIAYFGTPYFSANFLEKLLTDVSMNQFIDAKFIVTQPDKKIGRKQILTPSPVKIVAQKNKVPIIDDFKKSQVTSCKLQEVDLILLYAYGEIIPKDWLSLPKYGFWCLHPSLLPKYRGPSPMTYPLMLGDKKTGMTLYKMDEKIDHGPIIAQEKYEILPTDKRPDLENKLTNLGFEMFKKLILRAQNVDFFIGHLRDSANSKSPNSLALAGIKKDAFKPKSQDDKKATYTKRLTKQDGFIPLGVLKKAINNQQLTIEELPEIIKKYYIEYNLPPNTYHLTPNLCIYNLFRALYPWPGIWTIIEPSRLRSEAGKPGRLNKKRLIIADMELSDFKDFATLRLKKVQLEGKREVDFETFNQAYKIF